MSSLPSLPRLRPEVSIVPFSSSTREETYLVLLPDGRSLQASRRLVDLMTLLDGSRDLEELARTLSDIWNRPVRSQGLRDWIERYLVPYDLLVPVPGLFPSAPVPPREAPGTKGILLVPGRLALPFTRRLCVLFHPLCALPLLWASAGLHSLVYLGSLCDPSPSLLPSLPVWAGLAAHVFVFLSVLFHEFGHLSACTYFDCPHGEIRLGLYLVFPVFYANVSPAWRLGQKARVVVDLGGMYFQLISAIPASLLFLFTREPVWLLVLLELDAMILFSLNPFLRFDGYWLCSDLLGIPNLRSRSRLLTRIMWARLLGRPSDPEAPFLSIRPFARVGLLLYTAGRYGFGLVVLGLLVRIAPARIEALPAECTRLLEAAVLDGSRGDFCGAVAGLARLAFMGLMGVAAGRMLVRAVRAASRGCRPLLERWAPCSGGIRFRDRGRANPDPSARAARRPRSCSAPPGPRPP